MLQGTKATLITLFPPSPPHPWGWKTLSRHSPVPQVPKCALPMAAPDMKSLKKGFTVTLDRPSQAITLCTASGRGQCLLFIQFPNFIHQAPSEEPGEELKAFTVLVTQNKQLTQVYCCRCHVAAGPVPSLSLTAFPHSEIHPQHL